MRPRPAYAIFPTPWQLPSTKSVVDTSCSDLRDIIANVQPKRLWDKVGATVSATRNAAKRQPSPNYEDSCRPFGGDSGSRGAISSSIAKCKLQPLSLLLLTAPGAVALAGLVLATHQDLAGVNTLQSF